MKIAIVNLITVGADLPLLQAPWAKVKAPESDENIHIIDLGKHIAQMGHEVHIFIADAFKPLHPSSQASGNPRIVYLPTRLKRLFPPAYMPFTPHLRTEIMHGRYDVVQSGEFLQWGTILCSLTCPRTSAPLVIWHELSVNQRFPGNIAQPFYASTLGRYVVQKTSLFVPRSYGAREHLIQAGIPLGKIGEVIHTGVNNDRFFSLPERSKFRAILEVDEESFLVSSIGRLVQRKGHHHLIHAFKTAAKKYPESRLIIVGDGPERAKLEKLILELTLEGKVRIIPYMPNEELYKIYNASDLMALPSLELFPNFTILESLACGTPVIYSSPGGERELGGDGYVGFYVPFGDSASLASKIMQLVENPGLRDKMGTNALELVKREFDMKEVAQRWVQCCEEVRI